MKFTKTVCPIEIIAIGDVDRLFSHERLQGLPSLDRRMFAIAQRVVSFSLAILPGYAKSP